MRDCKVIQDLWPLYIDGELNKETRRFVEEHITQCAHCQNLRSAGPGVEFAKLLENRQPTAGSPEKFVLKLKRRFQALVAGIVVLIIVVAGVTSYYGKRTAEQAYEQQLREERQSFKEQVLSLEEVSPSAGELLKKMGISLSIRPAVTDKFVSVNYRMNWDAKSQVKWVATDTNQFSEDALIDAQSGNPLNLISGGSSSSENSFEGRVEAQSVDKELNKIIMKTKPFYILMGGDSLGFEYKFKYDGGPETIKINKKFIYQGVEFSIDTLMLGDEQFKVNYRQLTPVKEVGVYQLLFVFDDRLGNEWSSEPDVALDVKNPKVFTFKAVPSPSKNWILKVRRVIRAVPGINAEIDL